jgi:hypothetical protein
VQERHIQARTDTVSHVSATALHSMLLQRSTHALLSWTE